MARASAGVSCSAVAGAEVMARAPMVKASTAARGLTRPALAFARLSNISFRKTETNAIILLVRDPTQRVNAAAKSRGARAAIRSLQWLFLVWGSPGRSFMPLELAQAV